MREGICGRDEKRRKGGRGVRGVELRRWMVVEGCGGVEGAGWSEEWREGGRVWREGIKCEKVVWSGGAWGDKEGRE